MPLSQIHKGMRGYGVTVFEGTKLEKFDVEVVGVLNNIGPSQNLILIKVDAPQVQRAGVIAGMSGSPIYIDGKVIGALAYAWQFAKEPIAGVTPIDEMLKIAEAGTRSADAVVAAAPRMSGVELLKALADGKSDVAVQEMVGGLAGATPSSTMTGAKPIAVPLSLSSFAPDTVTRFGKYLDAMGFVAAPSGSTTAKPSASRQFSPGDAIGAVLLRGDFNVAATGTVSY